MENDDKRTGRNIRAIRNANKINLGDFAQNLGLSESLLSKIESGARPASDDLLFRIANYAGVSYSQIKYGDLSRLEKGELSLDDSIKIEGINDIIFEDLQEVYETIFPIVEDEASMRITDFQSGVELARESIQKLVFTGTDCITAINYFIKASADPLCADYSRINILSCFGYLFVFRYKAAGLGKNADRLGAEKVSSAWGYMKAYYSKIDQQLAAEKRKAFLDKYNKRMSACMYRLVESGANADYAYYYLALRYLFGMMDESITLIGEEQMALFGESMLDSLWKMGNKYAMAWHELQEED